MPTPTGLNSLLTYLGVDYATFAPHEPRYFETLKMHLVDQGTITRHDELNQTNFAEAISQFQTARGLTADGLPGQDTLWALQKKWADSRNLSLYRTTADRVPTIDGYKSFRLRQDAVRAYKDVYAEVRSRGGVVTSAGSFRSLGSTVTSGRSGKSMHYSGLALDLSTVSGMRDPSREPYIITAESRCWRVWAKSDLGVDQRLDAVLWANGQTSIRQITARVIDLTELFGRHGFHRIGSRSSFPRNYLSAEWWHFQYEAVLVPFVSQFGIELLSLKRYDETGLSTHPDLWAHRKAIYRRRRNGWF